MSEFGDADLIVPVVEYEALLFAAVRDALTSDDSPNHPARVIVAKRAAILSDFTRKRVATAIIESPDARHWMSTLRALEEAGKPAELCACGRELHADGTCPDGGAFCG